LEGKPKWLFQAAQEALREYEEVLSFQNPQTPHLTLQYWPQLMEIEYGRICQQAVKLSSHVASFSLKVLGAKAFGSRGEDHVLYLDIPFSDELARLKKACPWPSAQPFSPHITLARIRHPQRFHIHKKHVMKALSDVSFELPVSMLRLYGEVHGRKQTPLQDFSFFGTSQTSSSSSSPF
jgi:2'-5' RNA ligase